MSEFIPLSVEINRLTDCKKLRKSLHTRYLSAAKTHGWHCSHWNGQINAENIHVKPKDFYEWIKKYHPEFIPKLPLEHQKIWKQHVGYFNFSFKIGVYDEPQPPETIEQARNIIKELMAEIRRLEDDVCQKQQTIDSLKPAADRHQENKLKNKANASKPRKPY